MNTHEPPQEKNTMPKFKPVNRDSTWSQWPLLNPTVRAIPSVGKWQITAQGKVSIRTTWFAWLRIENKLYGSKRTKSQSTHDRPTSVLKPSSPPSQERAEIWCWITSRTMNTDRCIQSIQYITIDHQQMKSISNSYPLKARRTVILPSTDTLLK